MGFVLHSFTGGLVAWERIQRTCKPAYYSISKGFLTKRPVGGAPHDPISTNLRIPHLLIISSLENSTYLSHMMGHAQLGSETRKLNVTTRKTHWTESI